MTRATCPPLSERRLDEGRLTLPDHLAEMLGDCAALCADPSGCALVAPAPAFEGMLRNLRQCSSQMHHAVELFALLAGTGVTARIDNRGRLSIPRLLLEWSGIGPNGLVLLYAPGDSVQLWEPRRLDILLRVGQRHLRELSSHLLREQLSLYEDA
jgi:DNA-binding transcriptional regulator/RsmH inhibitor MraZ